MRRRRRSETKTDDPCSRRRSTEPACSTRSRGGCSTGQAPNGCSRAQLVVLGPVVFNTEDQVTLPVEGTRPILQVEALLDAAEQPYLTTLYFG